MNILNGKELICQQKKIVIYEQRCIYDVKNQSTQNLLVTEKKDNVTFLNYRAHTIRIVLHPNPYDGI